MKHLVCEGTGLTFCGKPQCQGERCDECAMLAARACCPQCGDVFDV